ncbi:MAG: transporter [Deltaproteobacteria bacterium]|nr:MAG: transporter [Deltaproteobacteria bacterium]
MMLTQFKLKGSSLGKVLAGLMLACFVAGLMPAAVFAQAGSPALMDKPPAVAEEKKEEAPGAPTTCGPMISDTCLPITTGKFAMQVWWAMSLYPGVFTNNWRSVSPGGNFQTFFMPVKFIYGPTKDLETYVVVPFVYNWVNDINRGLRGPNNESSASFSSIGDITAVAKYNFLPEGTYMPALTAVGGVGFPTGHASNLNPGRLGQDAIGTGSFNFITGLNLFKYINPLLVHGQIWFNSPINIYKIHGEEGPINVRSREYLNVNLALELPVAKQWVLLFEVYSTWTWQNLNTFQGYQTPQTVIGILPGIEFLATDKLALAAGASLDLWGKNGVQKFTPMITAFYTF